MKFNFISICTYLCGVCPMYCSVSNYYGTQWVWEPFCTWILFLGTMEMHWMLASFIRNVFSPCDYRSQAMMINELSPSSSPMYFGNKYLNHAYLSSYSTLCRLLLGMKVSMCNCCGFGLFLSLDVSLWYLWWNCKILYFNWYLSWDTCCLSQSISTISFP